MKKTLVTSLAASLCFLSLSAFAATEISQQEAKFKACQVNHRNGKYGESMYAQNFENGR